MGCFSFICKECDKPILSNSSRGQPVKLFLLKDHKVIQQMDGEYDSYGRVFNKDNKDSIQWDIGWSAVCDIMFSKGDSNGIAAIHSQCWTGTTPTEISKDDPNQGCGEFNPDE